MYLFIGPYADLHDLLHAHLHFTCTYKPVTLIKHTTLYLACQPGVSGLYVLCFGMSLFLLSTYLLYLSGILGRILHRWNYVLRFMCLFVWSLLCTVMSTLKTEYRVVQSCLAIKYWTGLDINGCPLARGNQKSCLGKLRLISGCPNGHVDFRWMLI